jgi:hypothetical protein
MITDSNGCHRKRGNNSVCDKNYWKNARMIKY